MSCQTCSSHRVAHVCGKTADCCRIRLGGEEIAGEVPSDMGIGAGDYLEFTYCLDCGRIQGQFPLEQTDCEYKVLEDDTDE